VPVFRTGTVLREEVYDIGSDKQGAAT
jgi:hypothetical protein